MKYHYTPSQLAAIQAAEEAVDPKDLATQGFLREDPWSMNYWDDLREIDPLIDKQPKAEVTDVPELPQLYKDSSELDIFKLDEEAREKLREGWQEQTAKLIGGEDEDPRTTQGLLQDVRESALPRNVRDHLCGYAAFIGTEKEGAARRRLISVLEVVGKKPDSDYGPGLKGGTATDSIYEPFDMIDPRYSALAPSIPKFEDPRVRWPSGEEDDPSQAGILRLALQTGLSDEDIRRLKTKRLVQHRVVNQTRMGKIASIYVLSIAGNGNGLFGIGEGKSAEPEDARRQSMLNAVRNMKPIHRYENRTIYGEVHGKVGATEVELMSRPPGEF